MSKTLTIILFLASFSICSAQKVEFYNGKSYPATPQSGEKEVEYLIESQIIYPEGALENKTYREVFVSIKVSWDGKIDTLYTLSDKKDPFANEAMRLVELIVWEKDKIRKDKNLTVQQIKIIFDPKKYKRVEKRRETAPITTANASLYLKSHLDSNPTVIGYENINEYVRDNIKYPALALQQIISGSVSVSFIIEKNGIATNFKITKPLAGGCNEETIRLLKNIVWKPGFKDTVPVRTISEYTLFFNHPGNSYNR